MSGIWLFVVPVALFFLTPLLLGCTVAADCGSHRRSHLWFAGLTAVLATAVLAISAVALQP